MKQQLVGSGFIVGVLWGACMLLHAAAQDAQVGPAAPAASTAPGAGQGDPFKTAAAPNKPDDRKPRSNAGGTTNYSAGVNEILNMVQAGVSTEVIKTYIENSPVAYSLSAADVIALKEHAVPDELTTALMKRGATLRMQVPQSVALNATPLPYRGVNRRSYRLDPESYDYFQYYYLYPRTLAAANQRFYSSDALSPGLAPYGYGFSGPPAFWPLPPSAFGHP
jgi:hypothetical protein